MFSKLNVLTVSLLAATALASPAPVPGDNEKGAKGAEPDFKSLREGPGTGIHDKDYSWIVHSWLAGCKDENSCFYSFQVSGKKYNNLPLFSAYCFGTQKVGLAGVITSCELNDEAHMYLLAYGLTENRWVSAGLLKDVDGAGLPKIQVFLAFQQPTAPDPTLYNYVGNATSIWNAAVEGAQNETFEILPSDGQYAILKNPLVADFHALNLEGGLEAEPFEDESEDDESEDDEAEDDDKDD